MKRTTHTFSRRSFLTGSLQSAVALSLRSAITGLPVSFLLNGSVHAATGKEKFLIASCSPRGEAMNVNGPGTYGSGAAQSIVHPKASEIGNTVNQIIGGRNYTAADIENSAVIRLGERQVAAARCYSALQPSILQSLGWFNHRTMTNAHPEMRSVLRLHGALMGQNGRGNEEIPSAIAQETWRALGTTLDTPFVLNGRFTFEGIPLNSYKPTQMKALIEGSSGGYEQFDAIYEKLVNDVFRHVKQQGTPNQKRFFEEHLASKRNASNLADKLSSLMGDITDNGSESELKAALAIVKIKLAPVVVVQHRFSGDNHGDTQLANECAETLDMIKSLNAMWDRAADYNVRDSITYATLGVFGRNPKRNGRGGRDHYGRFTSGMILGTHLKGGVIGGIEGTQLQATGINASTGRPGTDIKGDDTLAAYFKTLMQACGVSTQRCNVRIPDGKIVQSLFA